MLDLRFRRFALMKREAVALGILDKARRARRKLVDGADVDASIDQALMRRNDIGNFEIESRARSGLITWRIAVECKTPRPDVELHETLVEFCAGLQAEDVAVELHGARNVSNGIRDEGDFFDHRSALGNR
jgi:hypothetical protein